MDYFKRLSKLSITNFRFSLITLVCLLIVIFESFSIGLIIPIIFKKINIDQGIFFYLQKNLSYFFNINNNVEEIIIFLIITCIFLRQISIFFREYLLGVTQAQTCEFLRARMLSVIFNLKMQVYVSNYIGEFTNLIYQSTLNASNLVKSTYNIIFNYILLFGYISLLVFFARELAIIIIFVALFFIFLAKRFNKVSIKLGNEVKNYNRLLFSTISEYIKGIKLIKIRSYENPVIENLGKQFHNITNVNVKYEKIKAVIKSFLPLFIIIVFSLLIYLLKLDSKINETILALVFLLLMRLQQVLSQLNNDKVVYNNYLPHFSYIEDFFRKNNKNRDITNRNQINVSFKNSIIFKKVSFKYNLNSKIKNLKNINLRIKKNQITGIFGPSGSGKSTIVELLSTNYKPSTGSIYIDNKKLDESMKKSFRNKIGLVSQENIVFNNSIFYNLMFGNNQKKNNRDIWEILEKVNLKKDFNKYQKKLNYNLGESGNKISGGQKQRLNLARALMLDPEVLILDEPTSSLDRKTEDIIKDVIRQLKGRKTIIIISHSRDLIKICDKTYFIQNGKFVKKIK